MIRFGDITIDRATRAIHHGDLWHRFQFNGKNGDNLRFKLFQHLLLCEPGLSAQELFSLLYDDDPNGGPLYGADLIRVMIAHAEPILQKLNLQLHAVRHLSHTIYWVTAK